MRGIRYNNLKSHVEATACPPTPPSLQKILDELKQADGYIDREMLMAIAKEKNGGKISPLGTGAAIARNSNDAVKRLTAMAFNEDHEEVKIRILCGLDGVRLPTASCILAWRYPDKYGVIDRKACGTINKYVEKQFDSQRISHWPDYLELLRRLSGDLSLTAMQVDRRLYSAVEPPQIGRVR